MYYKGTTKKLGEIGEELGVDYVLEGTVRWDRSGGRRGKVRITPQLIHVADDRHLWSDRYDQVLEETFEVQSSIAQRVIERLEVALLEPERQALEARPTENMEAYNAFLRGSSLIGMDPTRRLDGIALLERAVELDPGFALAHARLSMAHSAGFALRVDRTKERADMARRSAERALEIDPGLPIAHLALGQYYEACLEDFARAREEYYIVLDLNPNSTWAPTRIAMIDCEDGQWAEALAGLRRAIELDPLNSSILNYQAMTLASLRRYAEAAATAERAITAGPDELGAYVSRFGVYLLWYGISPQSRRVLEDTPESVGGMEGSWVFQEFGERNFEAALQHLARVRQPVVAVPFLAPKSLIECWCFEAMGKPEEARRACESAVALLNGMLRRGLEDPAIHSLLGNAYAYLGRNDDAIREGKLAVNMVPLSEYAVSGTGPLISLAQIYARVGEPDAALDLIDHLLSIPSNMTVARLRLEPYWDPLRDHPRFQEILEKYGEEE
jgi:serine/threonine-protein kinase